LPDAAEDSECAFPDEDTDALDVVFFNAAVEGSEVSLEA
jgi:hypothetical protein